MIANIWENPNALEEKREQPRAWYIPYSDIDSALSFTKGRSDRYRLLNGDWNFYYCDDMREAPEDFHTLDCDEYSWDTLPVPSNWQMFGYDVPAYVNVTVGHRLFPLWKNRSYSCHSWECTLESSEP